MSGNFFFSCSKSEKEEACEFILLFLAGEKLCTESLPWKTTLTRSRTTGIERRAIHCLVDVNGPGDRRNDVFLLGRQARAHKRKQEGERVQC